jgi:hypothetical protein
VKVLWPVIIGIGPCEIIVVWPDYDCTKLLLLPTLVVVKDLVGVDGPWLVVIVIDCCCYWLLLLLLLLLLFMCYCGRLLLLLWLLAIVIIDCS